MTCGNIIHFTVRTSYMRGYSISSYCICSIYSIVYTIGYNSLNTRTSLQIKCSLVINRYFVTYTNNHKSSNSIASKYQSGNHNKKRMILPKTKVYSKNNCFLPKAWKWTTIFTVTFAFLHQNKSWTNLCFKLDLFICQVVLARKKNKNFSAFDSSCHPFFT